MANNFKVWVESGSSAAIMNSTTFAGDSQRTNGFSSGSIISSQHVNSALRQSNLVIAALMDIIDDSNLSLTSSVADVKNAWVNYFKLTTNTANDNVVSFTINGQTYNKTINNVTNAANATNATSANTANNATNAGTATNYNTSTGNIKSKFDDIDTRLSNLGFRSGSVTLASGISATTNRVTRQGNYIVGQLYFNNLELDFTDNNGSKSIKLGTIPSNFRPKETWYGGIDARYDFRIAQSGVVGIWGEISVSINTNGEIWLSGEYSPSGQSFMSSFTGTLRKLRFGYEANPIT